MCVIWKTLLSTVGVSSDEDSSNEEISPADTGARQAKVKAMHKVVPHAPAFICFILFALSQMQQKKKQSTKAAKPDPEPFVTLVFHL